uniref:uncharacterized protein LOC128928721 n=1 Tax=Callithrix jacchus TaxID=9483 RepID=UPI0023DD5CFF|nr:uncharacterized protein LOC128928721 [Callithrix jacchus]
MGGQRQNGELSRSPPQRQTSPGQARLTSKRRPRAATGQEARGRAMVRDWPGCGDGGSSALSPGWPGRRSRGRARIRRKEAGATGQSATHWRAPLTLPNLPAPPVRLASRLACPHPARPWICHAPVSPPSKSLLKGPRLARHSPVLEPRSSLRFQRSHIQVILLQEMGSHGIGQLHPCGFAGYSLPPGCFHGLAARTCGNFSF